MRFDVVDPGTNLCDARIRQLLYPLCEVSQPDAAETHTREFWLSTSKRLAQQLGGDLTIGPLPEGTRYRLTFAAGRSADSVSRPRHDASDVRPRSTDRACAASAETCLDCRVLLVEDNEDHQPLLSRILSKVGSHVTVAENGKVALELANVAREKGRPFDAILMDVQMPVLDGLTATRMLRSNGIATPIIAVSARAVSTDRQKCFDAGCDDFVSKPVNRGELVRLLASHVGRTAAPD
ncbi:MAG: response regulator [Pirellulales bacterium]|nr:response regulator [Pirellulales bacterium]